MRVRAERPVADDHIADLVRNALDHADEEIRTRATAMLGNQGRSDEGQRLTCEWIWDGAIGPVRRFTAGYRARVGAELIGQASRLADGGEVSVTLLGTGASAAASAATACRHTRPVTRKAAAAARGSTIDDGGCSRTRRRATATAASTGRSGTMPTLPLGVMSLMQMGFSAEGQTKISWPVPPVTGTL